MRLRIAEAVALFLLGATAALIGDHSHVVTGTTVYYTDAVPFIWSSPLWFPVLVGAATVSLAELRLRLPAPRPTSPPAGRSPASPRSWAPTSPPRSCTPPRPSRSPH
ncbi:hypothetical protein [Mycobacterium sp. ZZG]